MFPSSLIGLLLALAMTLGACRFKDVIKFIPGGMTFMEIISMEATAPSTTLTNTAMYTTDSNQVRNFDAKLNAAWGMFQTTIGFGQIVSPQMHEGVQGIKVPTVLGDQSLQTDWYFRQAFQRNDKIGIYTSGSATAGDFEILCLLMDYEDGGPPARFTDPQTVQQRGMHLTTAYATITAATTAIYGGGTLLSAFTHQLKNGRDYALLGMGCTVRQAALCIQGPATGNYRIGVPGESTRRQDNRSFFADMSIGVGKGRIPVINAGDATSTTITTVNDENAASPVVYLYLVQMPDGVVPANR
jgi:hypothetical protein